jgi:hypothetical protein
VKVRRSGGMSSSESKSQHRDPTMGLYGCGFYARYPEASMSGPGNRSELAVPKDVTFSLRPKLIRYIVPKFLTSSFAPSLHSNRSLLNRRHRQLRRIRVPTMVLCLVLDFRSPFPPTRHRRILQVRETPSCLHRRRLRSLRRLEWRRQT